MATAEVTLQSKLSSCCFSVLETAQLKVLNSHRILRCVEEASDQIASITEQQLDIYIRRFLPDQIQITISTQVDTNLHIIHKNKTRRWSYLPYLDLGKRRLQFLCCVVQRLISYGNKHQINALLSQPPCQSFSNSFTNPINTSDYLYTLST